MRIFLFLFFWIIVSIQIFSQTLASYCSSIVSNGRPSDCWYDLMSDHLFVVGNFTSFMGQARNRFAEINATTGQLESFALNFNNTIDEVEGDGSRLFFSGQFSAVNGINRNKLAVIDRGTGQLLPWNPSPNGAVTAMCISEGKLFISGMFTQIGGFARNGWAVFDVYGLNLLSINYPHHSSLPINRIKSYSTLLAFSSDENLYLYNSVTANLIDSFYCPLINDFTIKENVLYACGEFFDVKTNTDSAARQFVFAYNLTQHGFLPLDPVLPITGQAIEVVNDTLVVSSFNYINSTAVGEVRKFDRLSGQPYMLYDSGLPSFFGQKFYLNGDKFISLINSVNFSSWQQYLRVYFMSPGVPQVIQGNSFSVCRNDTLRISVQRQPGVAVYNWTYSGFGAILQPMINGDSLEITFLGNATSGNLNGSATSMSGISGPSTLLSIVLKAVPIIDAGSSVGLNCKITQDSLRALPSNLTMYDYFWKGPGGFQSYLPTVPVNLVSSSQGKYELTITRKSNGCKNKDSTFLMLDTISPIVTHSAESRVLTCIQDSIVIDAAIFYPNDSLRWITQGSTILNPLVAYSPGTYSVIITRRDNFCSEIDTFTIHQNVTPPSISGLLSQATLTCVDSILEFNPLVTGILPIVYWKRNNLDSLPNPLSCNTPGLYTVCAIDLANGCQSQEWILVSQNTLQPHLKILYETTQLTCSDTVIYIQATTLSNAADTYWMNGSSLCLNDTMEIISPGWYKATTRDSVNGCITTDSLYVSFEALFETNLSLDTTVCYGNSIKLPIQGLNGQTPYYVWLNENYFGAQSFLTFTSEKDTMIKIKIVDQNGCYSIDSLRIKLSSLPIDSFVIYKSCDSTLQLAQIRIYSSGENPPFQYSLDESVWVNTPLFSDVSFGNHLVSTQNAIGCIQQSEVIVNETALFPDINFITTTNQWQQDTFLLIDLSQPPSDSCVLILNGTGALLAQEHPYYYFSHQDTGTIELAIQVFYPGCSYELVKTITVSVKDSSESNRDNLYGIEDYNCYPNPTNGVVNLYVSLNWKQNIYFEIYNIYATKVYSSSLQCGKNVSWAVDVNFLSEGLNYVKLISESDVRTIRLIKQQ